MTAHLILRHPFSRITVSIPILQMSELEAESIPLFVQNHTVAKQQSQDAKCTSLPKACHPSLHAIPPLSSSPEDGSNNPTSLPNSEETCKDKRQIGRGFGC